MNWTDDEIRAIYRQWSGHGPHHGEIDDLRGALACPSEEEGAKVLAHRGWRPSKATPAVVSAFRIALAQEVSKRDSIFLARVQSIRDVCAECGFGHEVTRTTSSGSAPDGWLHRDIYGGPHSSKCVAGPVYARLLLEGHTLEAVTAKVREWR